LQLHDAQGRQIPVMGMRDVEVHLTDETGRQVVLREHVAISSSVHQPILCFGRLMENGWGVNASEQNLVHATGVKIPIELQNKWWSKALSGPSLAMRVQVSIQVRLLSW